MSSTSTPQTRRKRATAPSARAQQASTLEIAQSLADAGLYVFPMTPDRHFIKGFSWDRGATRSRRQITKWWTKEPNYRIGVHCGQSGIVAVDLDRKNNVDGFKALSDAGLELPKTFHYVSSGGRGAHYLYRAPEDMPLTIDTNLTYKGRKLFGVDIRSGTGMILYNGPKVTKARIQKLAPAPEWALVPAKDDGEEYAEADLEAWLSEQGTSTDPKRVLASDRARRLATRFPEFGIGNEELPAHIRPMVEGLRWHGDRRMAYETARFRYTCDHPDAKYLRAFDRTWARLITQVEAEEARASETLFDKSPILKHIEAWTRAQEVTPEAGLVVVLARLASNISPRVVLPRVGSMGYGSLNILAALSGASGHGKNTLLDTVDMLMPRPLDGDPVVRLDGASSGEGLIAVYVDPVKDKDTGLYKNVVKTDRAFISIDEVETLEAVASRSGNSLLSTTRSLWSASGQSTPTATPERRRHLAGHSYRMALVVGIQPGFGATLLSGEATRGGTPQRFLFAKVALELPDDAPFTDDPGPLEYRIHESIPYDPVFDQGGKEHSGPRHVIPVDEDILLQVRLNVRRNKRNDGTATDGQVVQTRLRAAALLSILHGKAEVDLESWEWAGMLMKHSDQVRRDLRAAVDAVVDQHESARGRAATVRAEADEKLRIHKMQHKILERVQAGKHSRRDLRRGLTPLQKEVFDAALESLLDEGLLIRREEPGRGDPAVRFYLP